MMMKIDKNVFSFTCFSLKILIQGGMASVLSKIKQLSLTHEEKERQKVLAAIEPWLQQMQAPSSELFRMQEVSKNQLEYSFDYYRHIGMDFMAQL